MIISFCYGFIILLVLDMVNCEVNFTPAFRYPSNNGMVNGLISFIIYILLIFSLCFISIIKTKQDIRRFIVINIITVFIGLLLFWAVGAMFFIHTSNYA
ncbi:hypothetical protein LGK99_10445 [Clostridium algidicarnis]|nr:hypothetical protein [Clostridium algidicarnis]MBU3195019.1 hypothetical protein [Clostridium algidicarnis]MCB2287505.1 hypothetical protein [Clostridium algidicarnis]